MTLTKMDIVEKISETLDLSGAEAKDTVEEMLEIIKFTLASGEDLMISGFGKFQVNEKDPRKGRNPATGETMMLDGRKIVTFKCSGKLRNQINNAQMAE
nr:integration host factor subunit alpha [uncultured Desulfobacter sp.]